MDYKKLSKIADKLQQANSQPICDMATMLTDRQVNRMIILTSDLNRVGEEYFKIFDSCSFESATKVARVSFREPKYIVHHDRFDPWVLNAKERKWLRDVLTEPNGMTFLNMKDEYEPLTLWHDLIIQYNKEHQINLNETLRNYMSKPLLPNALPIDLPMPDYMQL